MLAATAVGGLMVAVVVIVFMLVSGRRRAIPPLAQGAADVLSERERLLIEREDRLNRRDAEQAAVEVRLAADEAEARQRQARLDELEAARSAALADVAGLSAQEAREVVLAAAEADARHEAAVRAAVIESTAVREAESRARRVIVTAIQRVAAEQTNDAAVNVVSLPSEDFKGRLIGKEGRNIRAFEQVTGVNLLIDDTPATVVLSCFDPLRREVARRTLEELIEDGRVHPARIEQVHQRQQKQTDELCLQAAEEAARDVGIGDLDPRLLPILGALRFRTSYGQNVLAHLVESAHIAATMAGELGLDVASCRRAAFLHDIGKAVVDESGSHALVGAELARRYGEHEDVVHAIEAHHNEVHPTTVEAVLTQAADAISGSRPGARRENLENYVQRLTALERIAAAHDGVDKVYAMQAGHEVRVMVRPESVSDDETDILASRIARELEVELVYPGTIRVTVVRESRATAVAR